MNKEIKELINIYGSELINIYGFDELVDIYGFNEYLDYCLLCT